MHIKKDSRLKDLFIAANAKLKKIDLIETEEREQKASTAIFEGIPNEIFTRIEKDFPNTARVLFYLALQIEKGYFGQNIKTYYLLGTDAYYQWDHLLLLLLYSLSRTGLKQLSKRSYPEIFSSIRDDPRWRSLFLGLKSLTIDEIEALAHFDQQDLVPKLALIKDELHTILSHIPGDPELIKGFTALFRHYFDHIANPSHCLIELLIEMKMMGAARIAVREIKNEPERSKGLLLLAEKWIEKNQFAKVFELWNSLLDKEDRLKISQHLVEKLATVGSVNQIVKFIEQIGDRSERNQNCKESCLLLLQKHHYALASRLAEMITEQETKELALSSMTGVLARQRKFSEAKKIAFSIKDRGYREDAIIYIVKAYLYTRRVNEAILFVDSIPNRKEKERPAKIIELSLKSHHEDEKIKTLRKIFSLFPYPVRPAA